MSLGHALQIGRTALTASQLGLQVAGNNLANAATPGYSRQVALFAPVPGDDSIPGLSIGRGVMTRAVRRQIDEALQARLYNGLSEEAAAQQRFGVYSAVETTLGELSDYDLSSELSAFFNSWSERANLTKSDAAVVQQGEKLASALLRQRGQLGTMREQIDAQLGASVQQASEMLAQIADLNVRISNAEVGGASANSLRDQRDQVLTELAGLVDVSVIDRGRQGIDVAIGGVPVVIGGAARAIEVKRETVNGQTQVWVATKDDASRVPVESGQIGSLVSGRAEAVEDAITQLDQLASQLIFEVNKLHSTGANARGMTSVSGTLKMPPADRTRSINDPLNQTLSGLPFRAVNGGFEVVVKQTATGQTETVRIDVDLDGITNAMTPGTADDTSAEDIRAALDAVPGLSAVFTSDGRLEVTADAGFEFSFANDSSGALAVLGVNAFFSGQDATDVAVRHDLLSDPTKLASGAMVGGQLVENATALKMASLKDAAVEGLSGRSLSGFWRDVVQGVGVRTATAKTAADAAGVVRESLETQRAAISGVNIDEEGINLLTFQRQYQAAARVISVADQMTDSLLALV